MGEICKPHQQDQGRSSMVCNATKIWYPKWTSMAAIAQPKRAGLELQSLFGDARFAIRIGRKIVEKRKLMLHSAERVCLGMGRFEPTDRGLHGQTLVYHREQIANSIGAFEDGQRQARP